MDEACEQQRGAAPCRWVAAFFCLLLVGGVGCWNGGPTPDEEDGTEDDAGSRVNHPVALRESLPWDTPRSARPPTSLQQAADEVNSQLARLATRLQDHRPITAEDVSGLVTEQFACGPLRPEKPESVYQRDTLQVWQSNAIEQAPEFQGAAGLAEALAELRPEFARDNAHRAWFRVLSVRREERTWKTDVVLESVAAGDDNTIAQHATWQCSWQSGEEDQPPRLSLIQVRDYQRVVSDARGGLLFADCTSAVLGKNPEYAQQLLRGRDYWQSRIQAALGIDHLGQQGLAVGDANGDGLDDLYLCQTGGLPNRLFLQNADGTATDVSSRAGVDFYDRTSAALFVDLDNDGDQDLVLATATAMLVLENQGQAQFRLHGEYAQAGALGLAAADYDGDGDLDIYACGYALPNNSGASDLTAAPIPRFDAVNGQRGQLWQNVGMLRLSNATSETGLDKIPPGWSIAAAWEDYDLDGDPDLCLAEAFGTRRLLQNDQGSFRDVTNDSGIAAGGTSRAVVWNDFNRDGRPDLLAAGSFSPEGVRAAHDPQIAPADSPLAAGLRALTAGNQLLQGAASGGFDDVSQTAGVVTPGVAWGTAVVDVNNDGWPDAVFAQGEITGPREKDQAELYWREVAARSPTETVNRGAAVNYTQGLARLAATLQRGDSLFGGQRNRCLLNLGNGRFADISAASGLDWTDDARAIATVDWDQDGRLDVWISNRTAPQLRFLRGNPATAGHYLGLRLVGKSVNRDAVGARVEVLLSPDDSERQVQTLHAGSGFAAQSSKVLHFALGDGDRVEQVTVHWPAGQSETFSIDEVDRRYELVQGTGSARPLPPRSTQPKLRPAPSESPATEASTRVWLAARPPLPTIRYDNFQGRDATLQEMSGTPVLAMFWASWSNPSRDDLAQFNEHIDALQSSGLKVIALCVDGIAGRPGKDPKAQRALAERLKFPFPLGAVYADGIDKLEILQLALFTQAKPLEVPVSVLIDEQGAVAAIYRGQLDFAQLAADAQTLTASPESRRRLGGLFAGTWHAPVPTLDWRRLGQAFLDGGYPSEAVTLFERARREDSQNAEVYAELATALAAVGRTDDARQHYEEALRRNPNLAMAHYQLAQLLAESDAGNMREAIRQYRAALELAPEFAAAHLGLARAMQKIDVTTGALPHFREAARLEPNNIDARVGYGAALIESNQAEAAAEQLQAALEIDPQHGRAQHQWAVILMRQDEIKRALRHFANAERLLPDDPDVLNGYGAALARAGKPNEAIEKYKAGLAAQPANADLNYNLAVALQESGDVGGAIRHYRRALAAKPDWPVAKNGLAWVLATSDNPAFRDPAQAVRLAEEASRATGGRIPELLDTLAAAYAAADRFDRAVSTAERAVDLANQSGRLELAAEIASRLAQYTQEKAYVEPAE